MLRRLIFSTTHVARARISINTGTNYSLRSGNESLLNFPLRKSYSTLGDRSFSMAAPHVWSSLPIFIRRATSVINRWFSRYVIAAMLVDENKRFLISSFCSSTSNCTLQHCYLSLEIGCKPPISKVNLKP